MTTVSEWLAHHRAHLQQVYVHGEKITQVLRAVWELHKPASDGACEECHRPAPCGTQNTVAYWLGAKEGDIPT